MDRYFDQNLEDLPPMPEAPKPDPVEIPMEKTVLVDYATEVENKKNYLEEGHEPSFKKKRLEGTVAPPVDVYEPGFRTDLVEAIKRYWSEKAQSKKRVSELQKKLGLGRY